jgi:hypothetical protein
VSPRRPIKTTTSQRLLRPLMPSAVTMDQKAFPMAVRPLTQDEGGFYLLAYPDLPGCLSDGKSGNA